MRLRHALLGVAVLLLAAAVAVALLLPSRIDPAWLRDEVQLLATQRLGAVVAIDGPVRLDLLPRPVLSAAKVSLLHGGPGDPDALAVTAGRLTARLDLSALWHGGFATDDLLLDDAEVQAPFPFDLRVLTAGRPAALRSASIWLRRGRLRIGALRALDLDARLLTDRTTGDIALSGTFRLADGTAWRGGLRLGRPGGDGAAAFDATLDQTDRSGGLTATLSGQVAGDGGFAGRVAASGSNLAWLLPAPPVAFSVAGRASLAGGIATLDDAAVTLDAVPARLDASLRMPPQARLELRLATSRLDLDGWRAGWTRRLIAPIPVSVEVTAEAAGLAGGVLRQMQAAASIDGSRVSVRAARAVVPGGMDVQLDGGIDLAAGTARLDVRLDGSDLRGTAAWLGGLAGLDAAGGLPGPFRSLSGRASLDMSATELEAHDIVATLDGAQVRGGLLIAGLGGARPSASAILDVDRLDLAPWLAAWSDGGPLWPWPGLDVMLRLTTPRAILPGVEAALDADLAMRQGALDLTRLEARGAHFSMRASGARSAEGRWSDATLAVMAERLSDLSALIPAAGREAQARWPALAAQRLYATGVASGTLDEPSANLVADLGGLHAEASVGPDLAPGGWRGSLLVHHPDAVGLVGSLGVSAAFLGGGSLAASTDAHWAGRNLELDNVAVRAGLLEAGGTLRLDLSGSVPALSGQVDAPVLRLPSPEWRSATPLRLDLLRGWDASLDVSADQVDGLGATLTDLRAHAVLSGAELRITGLAAKLPSGGALAGAVGLQAAATPPRATAAFAFDGARLGAQPWHPLGLLASGIAGTIRLEASGFAPAALLGTLQGQLRATAGAASLMGMDVGRLGADLSDAAVRTAIAGGRTILDQTSLVLDIDQGLGTLRADAVASGGARIEVGGTVDLPDQTVDLGLGILPGITDPPRIELRLTGPADRAALVPELTELARWRASHP